jgi:hypothetical protein
MNYICFIGDNSTLAESDIVEPFGSKTPNIKACPGVEAGLCPAARLTARGASC